VLEGLHFPKRRADWRLGRWTAKRAVATCLGLPHDAIEVASGPSGAPRILLSGSPLPIAISITHRDGVAACAVAEKAASLGCDLELPEERSYAFVADYFETEEQTLVAQMAPSFRYALVALIWSGKESALKALQTGLRLDTRSVAVRPGNAVHRGLAAQSPGLWHGLDTICPGGIRFQGWWQFSGGWIRTVVAAPAHPAPVVCAGIKSHDP
jgi:4'-phosphopantetheinyl transferase